MLLSHLHNLIPGATMLRLTATLATISTASAWNDIAGALTYKGDTSLPDRCRRRECVARAGGWEEHCRVARASDCRPCSAGTSHVFQGCPGGGQPGSSAHGWHHAATTDLVHWEDRGTP